MNVSQKDQYDKLKTHTSLVLLYSARQSWTPFGNHSTKVYYVKIQDIIALK